MTQQFHCLGRVRKRGDASRKYFTNLVSTSKKRTTAVVQKEYRASKNTKIGRNKQTCYWPRYPNSNTIKP